MKFILITLAGACSLCAQDNPASVMGPVLGVVFDASTSAVRPIAGIPASAMLGEPFDAGSALKQALPGAEQGYAVGIDADSGAAMLISASGRIELSGVRAGATRIAVSPRGRAAAFYFADSRTVQVVASLATTPRVLREFTIEGAVSLVAVSDDGEAVLAAVDQDEASAVVLAENGKDFRLMQRASRVRALDFIPDSHKALFAETAANAVQFVGANDVTLIADERDGIADAVAVAASNDGSTVFIAMRSGQVAARKLDGGEQTIVPCSCQPTTLARLRGSAVFRLNGVGDGPVWILDASGEQARILFVAAAVRSEQ